MVYVLHGCCDSNCLEASIFAPLEIKFGPDQATLEALQRHAAPSMQELI
jgi:hypothetical protein